MTKILAIDDMMADLISLKTFLQDAFPDAVLYTETDGPKGIEMAIAKDPDVILLDILMPKIDGFEICRQLKEDKRVKDIPIIFITGHGNIPMTVKAMKAGAIDFLSKPFTAKQMLEAIRIAVIKSKALNKKQSDVAVISRRIKTLSPRELEVFHFVAQGMMNKQIASKRGISLQTIKVHRSRVMRKMQAKTVTELIHLAQKTGIVPTSNNYL